MGYETEVLTRAKARYAEAVEEHRQQARRRQSEIYARLPEVAELDDQIRQTMVEVISHVFRQDGAPTLESILGELRDRNLALQRRREELLRQEGFQESDLDSGPMCRKCADTGYVGETMCACLDKFCQEEQRRALTSLLKPNVSFDEFSLDYYPTAVNPRTGFSAQAQMEMVYEDCVDFARHFRPGRSRNLLLSGAPGLGKTFLSACIAQEVVTRGCSVVYDSAIHLFSCLEHQKFGSATEEELKMVQRIFACDLLILDDLGTEMASPFITSALYSVVNGRILSDSSTIISTNLTMEQLAQRYSPQIASRLEGAYDTLYFVGNDIRKLKKQASL